MFAMLEATSIKHVNNNFFLKKSEKVIIYSKSFAPEEGDYSSILSS